MYSWHKVESNDKKRTFTFANNKDDHIKNKNDQIKKGIRRTNYLTNYKSSNNTNNNVSIRQNDKEEEYNEDKDESGEEVTYEYEIVEEVRKYKVKIYENFLNKLKMEKRNEALRNKQLEIITDDTLKRNLEIQFSQERALVDLRLKKESERLHKQIKDYESNLRNNFQQRQKKIY